MNTASAIHTPSHPDVDWNTLRKPPTGERIVDVKCPICGDIRPQPAGMVRYRIKKGFFTGLCYKDRLFRSQREDRLGDDPIHPSIDWDDWIVADAYNGRASKVRVTCQICGQSRYIFPGTIRIQSRAGKFTGNCQRCGGMQNRKARNPVLTRTDPKGYIRLTRAAIDPADYWLFDAMKGGRAGLAEHRFVMAKHLGRPIEKGELVDHMDGNRGNNDISNLRIYRIGNNDPGSHNGNGTYYHEWQCALAEIARLTALLESHS